MSFDFHHDKPRYFEIQYLNSKNYILPFIQESIKVDSKLRVMEIGCAEGGVLKAFTELGCNCFGVELSASKVENAKKFMADEIEKGQIQFVCQDIYDLDFESTYANSFDVIILKDTIEHIHDQQKLIGYLHKLLRPNGLVYFGFPAWYMPWGGHQQVCKSKLLTLLPYFHLLPMPLYKLFLKVFGETEGKIAELVEIKETGISTHRFETILKKTGYKVLKRTIFFVNPIYIHKFGWKTKVQWNWLGQIPILRDLLSTTVYYSISYVK